MKQYTNEDIKQMINRKEIISIIENSFRIYESGNFKMPDRMHVHEGDNTLLLMPCFSGDYFSTKLVSVFPGNREINKPAIYGNVILNCGKTGEPLAIFDGATVTSARTGAVGAVGVKYLSPENASSLGIIGAGVQGISLAQYSCEVRNFRTIYVFDPNEANIKRFNSELKSEFPDIEIIDAENSAAICEKSDVIITATTSEKPVISDSDIVEGKTYIGIGSFKPQMREFPDKLLLHVTNVFSDTDFAVNETGDLKTPIETGLLKRDNVYTLGKIINGDIKPGGTTQFFKSVGMALFDLETVIYLYSR